MPEPSQPPFADYRRPNGDRRLALVDAILTFAPLAAIALVIRVLIAPMVGHPVDINTFVTWGRSLAEIGLGGFYNAHPNCDYLPGYLYILWVCGKIASGLPPTFTLLIFKLPNLIADVGIAWLIWRQAGPTHSQSRLFWPALYLFNPVVIFNSAYWGQADSFHAFVVLAGLVFCWHRRFVIAAVVLGFACTVKPHSIVIVPLVITFAFMNRVNMLKLLACLVFGVGTFLAAFVAFAGDTDAWTLALERVRTTMELYPFATVNALNLWYASGKNWVDDSTLLLGLVSIRAVSITLVVGGFVFLIGHLTRGGDERKHDYWRVAAGLFLLTYFCSSRVHERHVFPAFVMLLCAVPSWRSAAYYHAIGSVLCFMNMVMAWGYIYSVPRSTQLGPVALTVGVCVSYGALVLAVLFRLNICLPSWDQFFKRAYDSTLVLARRVGAYNGYWLVLILAFAGGLRFARLGQPEERVFDEVYHAYTAEQWAKGKTDPWRWDTTAPDKDCSYEWTHPPLAKLIMTASIKMFGANAFAWRLPSAITGVVCVLLVFALGRKLFDSAKIGLLAAMLMSLDALPLVMSRIAMNDVFCVAFVLGGALAALSRRHFSGAILVGCAIACKWTGLFAIPLLIVIRLHNDRETIFKRPKRWVVELMGQGVLVVLVYLASYVPFFRAGNTTSDFAELQRQMWGYHVGGDLHHDGSSRAWQWPMGEGTLWFYAESYDIDSNPGIDEPFRKKKANIYAMGNLLIWWAGLGAAAFCILPVVRNASTPLTIALIGYLIFWVPWIVSPRIMFIYHYLPALPFLYLLLAWSLVKSEVDVRFNRAILGMSAVVLAIELPFILGIPLPVL